MCVSVLHVIAHAIDHENEAQCACWAHQVAGSILDCTARFLQHTVETGKLGKPLVDSAPVCEECGSPDDVRGAAGNDWLRHVCGACLAKEQRDAESEESRSDASGEGSGGDASGEGSGSDASGITVNIPVLNHHMT